MNAFEGLSNSIQSMILEVASLVLAISPNSIMIDERVLQADREY